MFGVGKSDGIPFDKVLPEETTGHIFTYIGLEAIQNAALVSKNWNRFSNDSQIWSSLMKDFLKKEREQEFGFKNSSHELPIKKKWSLFLQATEMLFTKAIDKRQSFRESVLFIKAIKKSYIDSLKDTEGYVDESLFPTLIRAVDLDIFSHMIMQSKYPAPHENCKQFWDNLTCLITDKLLEMHYHFSM